MEESEGDNGALTEIGAVLDGRVGRRVAWNATLLSGAQGANLLLHLVWFALLSSHLGPGPLGTYVFAVAVPDLLGPVVDFGFTAMVARTVAQEPRREGGLIPNLFYLRLVVAAACYGATIGFLHLIGYHPATVHAATVATIIALLTTMQSLQVTLEVRLKMAWVAIGNLVESLILVGGVVLLVHHHAGLVAFIWLYVAATGVSLAVAAGRALTLTGYRWRPEPAAMGPVIRAALPLGATGVITGLYYRLDVLVLARVHNSTAVGQFGAGYRFIDAFAAFPGLLVALLNPVFARAAGRGGEILRRRFGVAMHLATVPTVIFGVSGAMVAWRALPALHAFRHYHGGGEVLAILSPAAGLILMGSVLSGVLFNSHQQRLLLAVAVGVLTVNLVLVGVLVPVFSYLGAAAATTAVEAVSVAALAVASHRRLGTGWPLDRLRQTLLAGGLLAAVLAMGYLLPPLVQLALGAVAAPVLVVATGALSRADLAVLRRST
ncbi:MAG TPA: oligosaccharide flippase family protein [Acidimicrobiales bacterium]|nr:oligosaccharide flippase family protein [Acidimicrobiales bacterium]